MPKLFGRDPALWVAAIATALSLLATFQIPGLSGEQAALWVVAINAVLGAVTAFTIRPIAPGVFTYAVGALASLVAAYGYELSDTQVGAVNAVMLAVLGLIIRQQVSPQDTAVSRS